MDLLVYRRWCVHLFLLLLPLTNASFEGGKISNSCSHTTSVFEHCIYSHNELDLPGITSPLMYEKIAARQSVPQLYEAKLIVRFLSPSFSFLAPPNAFNSNRKKT